jgi:hypothetical protein
MGTKKKASPRSSHLKGKLNDLIPQEHLDFYSKIYQRMENLRKQVPRVRQNEKYLSKRFREIHNLCEAGFLPEVSPFMSIWEWQKKNNPELTQLLLIERLKTREKSSDRSGAPPNFPINFLIYALIYELRQKTGKPHYKEVGDFLQEKEIRPLNVPKDDYLSESGIQKICKNRKRCYCVGTYAVTQIKTFKTFIVP